MSAPQMVEYSEQMGGIKRPFGGYIGCGYTNFDNGTVCQHNSMNKYHPNKASFYSKWVSNVDVQFPQAVIDPKINGLPQIMMGGGGGMNGCEDLCTCAGDPSCPCTQTDLKCGWPSVNQTCMEPVPNGQFPSLAACEAATSTGQYGKWV
jgi:hypothetical protein